MSVWVRLTRTDADLERAVEIYNEVWPRYAITTAEAASWRREALENVELLARVDDLAVGSAIAAVDPRHPRVCFTLIAVRPGSRRRGAGSALYGYVEAWAGTRDVDAIETLVEEDDDESLQFGLRRGFEETSRESGLELDVTQADARTPQPDGFGVASLAERRDLAAGTWDVAAEAIPEIPGDEDWTPPPRARWVDDFLLGPATPPEAVYVAFAGADVIGYAKLRLSPDGRTAVHGMTAVRRERRGRGVATALKRAQIAWAKSQGIERLITANEVRNAAMRRVNERLGYVPAPGRIHLRRPLAPR